ncbi:hypothetical protein ACS0TY_030004 [Phlomoides rotata]
MMPCLLPSWISQTPARQFAENRQGWPCHLYPQCVYEAFAESQLPELLRTPLNSLYLQITSLHESIGDFISAALQPPEPLTCGLLGRDPFEIYRLAAGLWYTQRRDLLTSNHMILTVFFSSSLGFVKSILEEEKVHELLNIGEFPLYMLPIDEDVISFELDLAEKFSFGVIPNVRAMGKAAIRVADILNRMQTEESVSNSYMGIPEINTHILLDREMLQPITSPSSSSSLKQNNGILDFHQKIPLKFETHSTGYKGIHTR